MCRFLLLPSAGRVGTVRPGRESVARVRIPGGEQQAKRQDPARRRGRVDDLDARKRGAQDQDGAKRPGGDRGRERIQARHHPVLHRHGGMDGYETCRRLRQGLSMEKALITAVSGYGSEEGSGGSAGGGGWPPPPPTPPPGGPGGGGAGG